MSEALDRLTSAAALLGDPVAALEHAVTALHDALPRGVAFGLLTAGPHAERAAVIRMRHRGAFVPIELPHVVHVRTPAFDVAQVPADQRNRWVEPFRDGVATPQGLRDSTIWPFVRQFGVLDLGRVAVCAGARMVAMAGVAAPEDAPIGDADRPALIATAEALVVPLRVAATIADLGQAPLERFLDASDDALLAVDEVGELIDASRRGMLRVRRDRDLLDVVRAAVRSPAATVARPDGLVLRRSPCALPRSRVAWLVALDDPLPDPPVALTPRQKELLALLARDLTNAEIARALEVAPSTVKTVLERLYRAAAVANRVELLGWVRANHPEILG
jgi:DNA-binding CsgD family transcriptional regulator